MKIIIIVEVMMIMIISIQLYFATQKVKKGVNHPVKILEAKWGVDEEFW